MAVHNSKFVVDEKLVRNAANPFSSEYNKEGRDEIGDYSNYFHNIQAKHCDVARQVLFWPQPAKKPDE